MSKLGSILLIDDSDADNFIHCRRLDKMGVAGEVVVRKNGKEGLDYLTTPGAEGRYPCPDLLFLDINMPVMDGWEFLDAYYHVPEECRAAVMVVMLTSSVGDLDYARAREYTTIDAHESKPLTKEKINSLLDRYFAAPR
ncbi:response regulator [Lewinella sp. JB7]|uniref:response regulator n=1 Tax=Lewinella sp. JB7 TaxID=2962887 RepID=UPI0020C98D1A|nr:response regulator [Lewinella sp. JB7]MCP9237815.1 response regulator [Lewinella sp. JB7]